MALKDFLHAKAIREENERLQAQVNSLNALLTPELHEVQEQKALLEKIKSDISAEQLHLHKEQDEAEKLRSEINGLLNTIRSKQSLLVDIDEQLSYEEVGLYRPSYDFANSTQYADKLKKIREEQKQMIKDKMAAIGGDSWTVDGSLSRGRKMSGDMKKLLLRAFNGECDDTIGRVKYNTFETAKKRITNSYSSICKLGSVMHISLSQEYYELKMQELRLALDFRIKKQQEKEEQAAIRAQMREEAKLRKEIDEARKQTEKEQHHYENALTKILKQIENASEIEKLDLVQKKNEIEAHLAEIKESLASIDYREANVKAGYVYVISNIGAFGENVYKIGMTRRLDPMERVDELGDASVPFDFDVHAMIFSDDAPKLEAALHKAFEDKKVNMVNTRREFFRVSLDEIKRVIAENYDKTVEFEDVPDAEQYRMSEKMRVSSAQ